MLAVFFILLREGVEAALIVGIVASFLKQSGRGNMIPKVWLGMISAAILCLIIGWVIHIVIGEFPQRQQAVLSGVIALLAVAMLTYMIFWMKKAGRTMKAHLQAEVTEALQAGNSAGWALVGICFLAVMREGMETVFFLLAIAENLTTSGVLIGSVLGLLCAIIIGWLVYEGGVRINLAKFFRWTGVFLIIVAAGLTASAFRNFTAAGFITWGGTQLADLSGFIRETSNFGALLHGFFGYTDKPTVRDAVIYIIYLVPTLFFFLQGSAPKVKPVLVK